MSLEYPKKVEKGVDLEDLTGRSIYQGYIIDDVYTEKGKEYIRFTNGKFIRLGDDNSQDNQSYNEYIKKMIVMSSTHMMIL